MARVIVVTNFSASSRNALDYTCQFLHNPKSNVLLLNIFNFPGSFSGDAMALAAMSETIANDERKLKAELDRVKQHYPDMNISAEMETGVFMEILKDQSADPETALFVMGAGGRYNDLLSWDSNIIDAFADLDKPVLVIPDAMRFQPVQRIAFACNYYRENLQQSLVMIRKLLQFTKAQLYIIHVVSPSEKVTEASLENRLLLEQTLHDLSPEYFEPKFDHVIKAIDQFTEEKKIDMLIVIPSRHGIWYNIFNQNLTRDFVNLNHIPLLSLRQPVAFLENDLPENSSAGN